MTAIKPMNPVKALLTRTTEARVKVLDKTHQAGEWLKANKGFVAGEGALFLGGLLFNTVGGHLPNPDLASNVVMLGNSMNGAAFFAPAAKGVGRAVLTHLHKQNEARVERENMLLERLGHLDGQAAADTGTQEVVTDVVAANRSAAKKKE